MHEQHWQQLARLDGHQTARRAGCRYLSAQGSFAILLLNREYLVDPNRRTIHLSADATDVPAAGYLEQLCILTYLLRARDVPPAGELVNAEKLDPGGFFFRGSHALPTKSLEDAFGHDPDRLKKAGRRFGAVPGTFGDASVKVLVLPRIPMNLIIWGADEEFPARASILFDRTASLQMPLDGLYAVTRYAVKSIVSAALETD